MSNPLFLTLYCKTYNGNNGSLQELYERLIGEANRKIYHNLKKSLQDKGYTEEDELVSELVVQIADWFIINNKKTISQKELLLLNFGVIMILAPYLLLDSCKRNAYCMSLFIVNRKDFILHMIR